jgi:hypothetical protein
MILRDPYHIVQPVLQPLRANQPTALRVSGMSIPETAHINDSTRVSAGHLLDQILVLVCPSA